MFEWILKGFCLHEEYFSRVEIDGVMICKATQQRFQFTGFANTATVNHHGKFKVEGTLHLTIYKRPPGVVFQKFLPAAIYIAVQCFVDNFGCFISATQNL